MTSRNKTGTVFTYIFVWLALCTKYCLGDPSTCDQWAQIAKTMDSQAEEVTCTNNATSICTRYDCEGTVTERLSSVIEIDYCFGIQLNSCHDPLSLDFYMKIPSHNVTAQYRITHDQIVYLSDLGIPQVKNLPIKPLLDFELERNGAESVLVSVTFKVRSSIGAIYFDQYEENIIDEMELPLMPCTGPLTPDPSDKPAGVFMSTPCHPKKYPTPTSRPQVTTPATHDDKPSETLNKTCNFVNGCSDGETCQMESEGKGMCVCEPDYNYSHERKKCISQGSVGFECYSDRDCGVYEKCRVTKPTSPHHLSCQCEDGFSWDKMRRLCVHKQPHSHSTDDDHKHHTPGPQKTTTTTTTTEMPSNHTGVDSQKDKTSSSNTKYIIIAGSAVGGVVFIAVVVAGLLLCRHRRRNRRSATSGGLYDSDTPMLADNDDDVDLVM